MGTHAGLHVDAPAHFIAGAASLEAMPLEALVGIVRVIDVWSEHTIEVAHLEPLEILPGERVLFKTRNSELWAQDEFVEDYVYFSTEAARYLAARRPACVGIDYLSVGGFHLNGTEVHEALLGVGILLIEGLDLRAVEPGAWTLVCLPLRLAETEAAPARAILMR
jgi:arylformamidase